jgi:ferredoxin
MTHFNFKKTTGLKKKYSCGGYGGRCSMCSISYGDGKVRRKMEIENTSGSVVTFCLKVSTIKL